MRQRNDSGYPLNSNDMGRAIGPGEEFVHPVYVTGCTDLDAQAAAEQASQDEGGGSGPPDDTTTARPAGRKGGSR